jgi:hypothetical protein
MDKEKHSKMSRLFKCIVLFNVGLLSSNTIAWLMTENTALYAFYLIRIANFLHYITHALVLTAMILYMLAYIDLSVKVSRGLTRMFLAISAAAMLLIVISQFNNMYYYIDENNVYHRGEYFLFSQMLSIVTLSISIGAIFFYRKALMGRTALFLFTYIALPVVAIAIQTMFYGIVLVNVATTFAILILYIKIQIEQTNKMTSHILIINQQLEFQNEHYNTLQSHIAETKQARHDLRHHLSAFKAFIDSGETEKLTAYINEYENSLPDDTDITFCENYAVNSILRHYIGMTRNVDIHVCAKLHLPENAGVSDSDLCIVFGNCIENAIEACRKIEDGEKFIKIDAGLTGEMLTITIDNSFNGAVTEINGVFMSQKREGKGIGISSVKAVVQKYNGVARFEAKGNVFQASIMLQMKRD